MDQKPRLLCLAYKKNCLQPYNNILGPCVCSVVMETCRTYLKCLVNVPQMNVLVAPPPWKVQKQCFSDQTVFSVLLNQRLASSLHREYLYFYE